MLSELSALISVLVFETSVSLYRKDVVVQSLQVELREAPKKEMVAK